MTISHSEGVRRGRLDTNRLTTILANLPAGATEIFCHPATGGWDDMEPTINVEACKAEFAALVDGVTIAAVEAASVELAAFRDL